MALELHWVGLILISALIHASWNAVNKASRDPLLSMAVLSVAGGVAAGSLLPFLPPLAPTALPWLGASLVAHFAYQLALVRAYGLGDLSQVYPIARGMAPLGIALFASFAADEIPTPLGALGLVISAAAITSLAGAGRALPHSRRAVTAALQTALAISLYTTFDGMGVRNTPSALSYICWMSLLESIPIALTAILSRRGRVLDFLRTDGLRNAASGVLATLGYGIVMAAMAHGALASVAAVRETSVIFGAIIGTRILREPFGTRRILASCALAAGLMLLQRA